MEYIIAFVALLSVELAYFAVAKKFQIVDCPNERSSHSKVTLLGGGIVFYFAILFFSLYNQLIYPWFLLAMTIVAVVSYVDDLRPMSSLLRMLIQFAAVLMLLWQFDVFELDVWKIVLILVIAVGTINIYNFMDGINGMLAAYSLVVLGTLAYVNRFVRPFVEMDLILVPMIAVLVFCFFNFRKRAWCFSGDVGSIVMGCLILFLMGLMIQSSPTNQVELSSLVFIAVYLVDGGCTILKRFLRGENILLPHREHLYETLCNDIKVPHLCVSALYAVLQLIINVVYFLVADKNLYSICVVLALMILYGLVFFFWKRETAKENN